MEKIVQLEFEFMKKLNKDSSLEKKLKEEKEQRIRSAIYAHNNSFSARAYAKDNNCFRKKYY